MRSPSCHSPLRALSNLQEHTCAVEEHLKPWVHARLPSTAVCTWQWAVLAMLPGLCPGCASRWGAAGRELAPVLPGLALPLGGSWWAVRAASGCRQRVLPTCSLPWLRGCPTLRLAAVPEIRVLWAGAVSAWLCADFGSGFGSDFLDLIV